MNASLLAPGLPRLDERDLKILAVLQREGRITKSELAARVHLSPAACWERLRRLEADGIIEGYSARLSERLFAAGIEIFMLAELSSHRHADFERFERAIERMPEVTDCWAVGGGIDYFLKFASADVDAYQRLVDRMLASEIGLQRYFTYIVTKPVKRAVARLPDALPAATGQTA